MDVSIVVPAYNEEERIAPTLKALGAYLRDRKMVFEIVVVDDGSTDGTVPLVQSLRRSLPQLRCIVTSPNRGKGHAVRTGMRAATGNIRLMWDADGSMPVGELPRLVGPIYCHEADIVVSSRYASGAKGAENQPAWRRAWSRLANWVIQRSLVPGISDTQCGFKAFSARAANDVFSRATIDGWAFDLEVLALGHRLGYGIAERGVCWTDDCRSRVNPIGDFVRVVQEWAAIRDNLRKGVYGPLAPQSASAQPRACRARRGNERDRPPPQLPRFIPRERRRWVGASGGGSCPYVRSSDLGRAPGPRVIEVGAMLGSSLTLESWTALATRRESTWCPTFAGGSVKDPSDMRRDTKQAGVGRPGSYARATIFAA